MARCGRCVRDPAFLHGEALELPHIRHELEFHPAHCYGNVYGNMYPLLFHTVWRMPRYVHKDSSLKKDFIMSFQKVYYYMHSLIPLNLDSKLGTGHLPTMTRVKNLKEGVIYFIKTIIINSVCC